MVHPSQRDLSQLGRASKGCRGQNAWRLGGGSSQTSPYIGVTLLTVKHAWVAKKALGFQEGCGFQVKTYETFADRVFKDKLSGERSTLSLALPGK